MYSVLLTILVVLFFAVAFTLHNPEPITILFFSWTFEGSLAVILLTTLACGALLGVCASLPSFVKKRRLMTQQQKIITKLEHTVDEQSRLITQQKTTIGNLEQSLNEPKGTVLHPDPS